MITQASKQSSQSMTSKIQLYSGPLSMFGMKAHIAALEKGINVELILVPFNELHGYQPKHPEVIRVNPKQQVPILIHALIDGDLELFDSTQIFEYFEDLKPEPHLWPTDIQARAKTRLLELQIDEIYFPSVVKLMHLQGDLTQIDAKTAINECQTFYQLMETELKNKTNLSGAFSFADIGFYMAQLFGERMGAFMTKKTPLLLDWRTRMTARSTVQTGVKPLVDYLNQVNQPNRPIPKYLHFLID
jgi:glutathione S-transferase